MSWFLIVQYYEKIPCDPPKYLILWDMTQRYKMVASWRFEGIVAFETSGIEKLTKRRCIPEEQRLEEHSSENIKKWRQFFCCSVQKIASLDSSSVRILTCCIIWHLVTWRYISLSPPTNSSISKMLSFGSSACSNPYSKAYYVCQATGSARCDERHLLLRIISTVCTWQQATTPLRIEI